MSVFVILASQTRPSFCVRDCQFIWARRFIDRRDDASKRSTPRLAFLHPRKIFRHVLPSRVGRDAVLRIPSII